jgi:high-affinity nickel permease
LFGLDDWIAGLGTGQPLFFATVVAVLLGLRHATDPDHLAAVTTLVAAEPERRASLAARLGLAWGGGHATTLFLFGLPIVVASRYLPEPVQQFAEAAVGALIIILALRLLVRWRRGAFHAHRHVHDGEVHVHVHAHGANRTPSIAATVRSARTAYSIGLLHGTGGSAGVGVLLLAAIPDTRVAVAALLVFAVFTALSMATCSALFGLVLSRPSAHRRFNRLAPALALSSAVFGAWYIAAAFAVAPYPF